MHIKIFSKKLQKIEIFSIIFIEKFECSGGSRSDFGVAWVRILTENNL
jgi:hypothetical protein